MDSSELLYELKEGIEKAMYLKISYTCEEEKIINNQVIKNVYNKDSEVDYSHKPEIIFDLLNLGQIQWISGHINCETCQEYNYTEDKINSIDGYVESAIVICKLNNGEYKVDTYMKQVDGETNLEYETNIQYKIILAFR